jgi:hypothetical protein
LKTSAVGASRGNPGLERLTDGRIKIGSDIAERAIRHYAIIRENNLFARSDGVGKT